MADHTWSGKKHEKTTHVASNSQTSTVLPSCANMYYLLVPQISEKQLKEPLVVPGNCWNIMLVIHNNCSNAKCERIDIYTYTMILCASINIQPGLSHKHQKATPSLSCQTSEQFHFLPQSASVGAQLQRRFNNVERKAALQFYWQHEVQSLNVLDKYTVHPSSRVSL